MLSPTVPFPPVAGGEIRTFQILRRLAKHLDITLLCHEDGPTRALERATGIERALCGRAGGRVPSRRRLDLWRHSPHGIRLDLDPSFASALRELRDATRFDVVLVEHLYMLQYASLLPGVPVLLSAHNVESSKHARWFDGVPRPLRRRLRHWVQRRALVRAEENLAGRTEAVFAVSEVDCARLRRMNRGGRFLVAANGADLDHFRPRSRQSFEGPPAIVFVGSMSYEPNRRAAAFLKDRVLPLLSAALPGVSCHLIGSGSDEETRRLHAPAAGVHGHGFVEDVRPFLTRAQVLVAPITAGSGSRIKILEAMASGTPVVSTTLGAEGIACRDGVEIALADSPRALADAALALLRDRDACFRMGAAGRRLVEQRYGWERAAGGVAAEIERVLGVASSSAGCGAR